jgi:hypothetical protein
LCVLRLTAKLRFAVAQDEIESSWHQERTSC